MVQSSSREVEIGRNCIFTVTHLNCLTRGSGCVLDKLSQMNSKKVKTEDMEEIATSEDNHLHRFKVKFDSDLQKYTIDCRKPRTVLQAIKSLHNKELQSEMDKSQKRFNDNIKKRTVKTNEKIEVSEENIIIEVGEGNDFSIVATHFPCCLVEENQCLTIKIMDTAVEKKQKELRVLPKENYSVFFIDKELGEKSKYKRDMVFTCKNIPANCKYFCVYGIKKSEGKPETVVEALRRDGRFVDDLPDFYLSYGKEDKIKHDGVVDNLDGTKFKICDLPPKNQPKAKNPNQQEVEKQDPTQQTNHEQQQHEDASASTTVQSTAIPKCLEYAAKNCVSLKIAIEAPENQVDHQEIIKILRQQFPKLREKMKSRFPGLSFEKTVKNLKEEKFGKIQQSFSEVHRLEKLLKMGKSVCKVYVRNVSQGTGFVLFDRLILTSAHLFKGCFQGKKLLNHIEVYALFNYDGPEPETNYFCFSAEKTFIDIDVELDFAVLQLNPDGKKHNSKPDSVKVPPGLLNRFGPLPGSGEACLIGHPAGSVKKIDPTCIIEPEKRGEAVMDNLAKYKDQKVILEKVSELKKQGIDDIMMGGEKAEKVAAYNTFMYHGASGSPVFDSHGQIFGIHTGGYGHGDRIIEYAHLLLAIFEKFVINLKESGNDQMLEEVKEAVSENDYLQKILQVEPMAVD